MAIRRRRPAITYEDAGSLVLTREVILQAQMVLQDLGLYSGPEDGEASQCLDTAIEDFQIDFGLPITGKLDRPTFRLLLKLSE